MDIIETIEARHDLGLHSILRDASDEILKLRVELKAAELEIERLRAAHEQPKTIEAARPTDDKRAKWLGDALTEIERLRADLVEIRNLKPIAWKKGYDSGRADERDKREKLAADVERCLRMLLSEPDVKGALFKAENILREALADMRQPTTKLQGD